MKWVNRFENVFCGLVILLVTAILLLNVVLRYIFHASLSWADEAIRYGFIWLAFIGGAICVRVGAHVNVDLLPIYLSRKGKTVLFILTSAMALAFIVGLGKFGLDTALFTLRTGQRSPSLPIGLFYVYLAIPVGCLLMAIHYVESVLKAIRKHRVPEHLYDEKIKS